LNSSTKWWPLKSGIIKFFSSSVLTQISNRDAVAHPS
jgi:hypothetical protein